MTEQKKIVNFFKRLGITKRCLYNCEDWEIDFYLEEGAKQGLDIVSLARYIVDNKVITGRRGKKVTVYDSLTNKSYRSIAAAIEGTGITRGVLENDDRFEFIRSC